MTSAKENLHVKRLTMNNYLHGNQLGLATKEIRFWVYRFVNASGAAAQLIQQKTRAFYPPIVTEA